MNSRKLMEIKKEYRKQNGKELLEKIYYRSIDTITNKFEPAMDMLNELLESANERLSVEDPTLELTDALYAKYKKLHKYINDVLAEVDEIKRCRYRYFEEYIEEYKKMYYRIIVRRLGKGVSKNERDVYTNVLVYSEIVKYRRFLTDYINEYLDEFLLYHDELREVLSYIFNLANEIIESTETKEIPKEIQEDTQDIEYVAKPKDLEKIAKALGYEYKGQCGSHRKYQNIETKQCVVIPFHNKDMGLGLSKTIQKQLICNSILA